MARSTLRKYGSRFRDQSFDNGYKLVLNIGLGYTYSKYNTLMHFLNVMECYWQNPDMNAIQVPPCLLPGWPFFYGKNQSLFRHVDSDH